MKVYQITVEKDQLFAIYNRDGIATLINDRESPWVGCSIVWDKDTKQYKSVYNILSKIRNKIWTDSDKIVCPSYNVKKCDYQSWLNHELKSILETAMNLWGDENKFNVFLFKKYIKGLPKPLENTVEVGLMALGSDIRGKRCNGKLTNDCIKLLNLKAFW